MEQSASVPLHSVALPHPYPKQEGTKSNTCVVSSFYCIAVSEPDLFSSHFNSHKIIAIIFQWKTFYCPKHDKDALYLTRYNLHMLFNNFGCERQSHVFVKWWVQTGDGDLLWRNCGAVRRGRLNSLGGGFCFCCCSLGIGLLCLQIKQFKRFNINYHIRIEQSTK